MTTQELATHSPAHLHQAAGVEPGTITTSLRPHRRHWRMPPLIVACWTLVILFAGLAMFAHVIAPHDPIANNLRARLLPPIGQPGADATYWLGTDSLGRDLLSRLLYGARVSLAIGFAGTLLGLLAGGLSGLLSGFLGGIADEILMFLVDALVALPFLIVALTVIAIFGSSLTVLVLLSGFSGWTAYTRLARGQVLAVSQQPYVLAAKSVGAPLHRVIVRHIAPNIAAPMVVLAAMTMTSIILLESSLSFLGLGIQPPTLAWGAMLGDGRNYLRTAWWIGLFPGLAIMLLTSAISLIGDWLRDVLDPTLRSL